MMMLYTWAERVMADDESTSHSIIVLPMGHIFMMMQKFHNIMIHLKISQHYDTKGFKLQNQVAGMSTPRQQYLY
jgi:hypothetical protein